MDDETLVEQSISARRRVMHDTWLREAIALFGPQSQDWAFVCPSCGHVAKASDWKAAGAPEGAVAFSCVGRWLPATKVGAAFKRAGGPCNYAGGGLFQLNPVTVVMNDGKEHPVFAFARPQS